MSFIKCATHKMMTDGGLDARSVLEKAFGETTAEISGKVYPRLSSPSHLTPFYKGDPKSLLALVQHERPQDRSDHGVYMDPQQAAQMEQSSNEKS